MCWQDSLAFVRDAATRGVRLHPQFTTNELGVHLKLADTFIFDEMPEWRGVLTLPEPERSRRLRDAEVRRRLLVDFETPGRAVSIAWRDLEVEGRATRRSAAWIGKFDDAGIHAARRDAFLDCSLAEGLPQWQSRLSEVAVDFIRHVVRAGIGEPLVMAGSGRRRHLASLGADYSPVSSPIGSLIHSFSRRCGA
jgi:hypothetical protein